jgi:hypothetical protein
VRTPERYIAAVEAHVDGSGSETLEPAPRAEEACALALRTRRAAPSAAAAGPVDELAAVGIRAAGSATGWC